MKVRVVAVDDLDMHRSMLKGMLRNLNIANSEYEFEVVREFENGKKLIDAKGYLDCDLITLDIRMPVMDGLTTAFMLRSVCACRTPICMVSSEQESNIDRFVKETASQQIRDMPHETKLQHLAKVEERIKAGQIEDGKVNDLLTGCEKLLVDPRKYALKVGANGFMLKPYDFDAVKSTIIQVINGKCVNL